MSGFLTPDARLRVLSDLGLIAAGALLHTYVSGTPSTPRDTFSDDALTIPNLNPLVASAGGLFGPIYLTPGLAYKLVLTDALGNPLWSQDPVLVPASGLTAPVTVVQGGTGIIVGVSGGIPYFSGTTAIASSALLAAHGVVIGGGAGAAPVATAAGVAGQMLVSGGPAADPSFQNVTSLLLDKSTTEQVVSNTAAPTSIYSFSVPAGTLGTAKILRLTINGWYSNTSGGASTLAFTVTFGGTTIMSGSLTNFVTGTTGAFRLIVDINANGATNSQRAVSIVNMVASTIATTVGVSATAGLLNTAWHDAMAEDSTAAKTLSVSVTHGTAASTIIFKAWGRFLELLG